MSGLEVRGVDAVKAALLGYITKLDELGHDSVADAGAAAIDSARETISRTTTRRTGALEDSWHVGWADRNTRIVTNFAPHARFIESGTKPHRIVARRAKALRFEMSGTTMFRRSVNHPGTKARPFIRLAMAAGQMAMLATAREGANRLAREF